MEDAVRPNEQAARGMYARGYQTWSSLSGSASKEASLPSDCLQRLRTAFPNLPQFPNNLDIETFSNVALAKATTIWLASDEPGHLPSFQDETIFHVAWDKPTRVVLTADIRHSIPTLPGIFGKQGNHIPVLFLAWAYILSARWAELIPNAHLSQHHTLQPKADPNHSPLAEGSQAPVLINVGEVSGDAARWWTAILSAGRGWDATIRNRKGEPLLSTWSTTLESGRSLLISAKIKTEASTSDGIPTSFTEAYQYLSDYCATHGINDDLNLAALAAVLLIPASKYDNRPIALPFPEIPLEEHGGKNRLFATSLFRTLDQIQLDRLLTLSCNARGIKALLTSVFFEPDVECNLCGMWLRGSFAFLGTIEDPHVLLRTLMYRDPDIGFLWLGAFITGGHQIALREGRAGRWKIDLAAAAWTDTLMSFVQTSVPRTTPGRQSISRADECRLLYLCHDINYTTPPLLPFPPFGSTALIDTNLEVREHTLCGRDHGLKYSHMTWRLNNGTEVKQEPEAPIDTVRPKNGQNDSEVDVDYDDYDSEDENSEMVTRNIFTWLRGEDGFSVAERAIREHEWIDNLNSDDDVPIEGDVRSTFGGDLYGWLLKTSTQRSNSI